MSARRALTAVLLALAPCAATTVHALSIEPGLWRFDLTTENAFTGARQMQQETCVERSEFDPDMLRMDMGECTDLDFDDREDGMDWTFQCSADGVQGNGEGSVQVSGGEMTGNMRLVMSLAAMGGREFVIDSAWRGRRIGACR